MRFIAPILVILSLFACNRNKNKPYEDVNIIREDVKKQVFTPEEIRFPRIFSSTGMLIMEIDHGNVEITSWDEKGISVDLVRIGGHDYKLDVYESNNQVVVREKAEGSKGNTVLLWKCKVPPTISLVVRSQNGSVLIENVDGTFEIESPVGDVVVKNSKNAAKILCQSANITMSGWEQMGRSQFSSGSGKVKARLDGNLAYELQAHSGSDTLLIEMNGNTLQANVEILTFQGEGSLLTDYQVSNKENFYSDALERNYDLRKIFLNENYPNVTLSTGNGSILLKK